MGANTLEEILWYWMWWHHGCQRWKFCSPPCPYYFGAGKLDVDFWRYKPSYKSRDFVCFMIIWVLHNTLNKGSTNFEAKVCVIYLNRNTKEKPEVFAYEIWMFLIGPGAGFWLLWYHFKPQSYAMLMFLNLKKL